MKAKRSLRIFLGGTFGKLKRTDRALSVDFNYCLQYKDTKISIDIDVTEWSRSMAISVSVDILTWPQRNNTEMIVIT